MAFAAEQRTAVALKVDEAPLVLNRGFAETMALKRSAGLETVACWQTDAQWIDRDMRDQLDALFAHRVYFATASVEDARNAASLMMAEFSDTVRPGIRNLSTLGRPDVRLHLPRHSAIASWVTAEGRQAPFVAQTLPLLRGRATLGAFIRHKQAERGGRYLQDLSQPHWERTGREQAKPSAHRRTSVCAVDSRSSPAAPVTQPVALRRSRRHNVPQPPLSLRLAGVANRPGSEQLSASWWTIRLPPHSVRWAQAACRHRLGARSRATGHRDTRAPGLD